MENYSVYRKIARIAAHKILGRNKSHLDDCIQVGLTTIIRALPSFDESKKIKLNTYLYTCAYNRIYNYVRDSRLWKEQGVWEKTAKKSKTDLYERVYYDCSWVELLDSLSSQEKNLFKHYFVDKIQKTKLRKIYKLTHRELNSALDEIKLKLYKDNIN